MINKGQEPGHCINLLLKSEFNRRAISTSLFPLKESVYLELKDSMTATEGLFLLVHKELEISRENVMSPGRPRKVSRVSSNLLEIYRQHWYNRLMSHGKMDAVLCVFKQFQRKTQGTMTVNFEEELRQNKRNTHFSIPRHDSYNFLFCPLFLSFFIIFII